MSHANPVSVFTGHLPGTREYRRLLTGLFFAGVATFAQLYAPQAVLPQIAAEADVSAATAALTVSAATLGLAAAVIPWSMVADRIGRVPAMVIGISAATALGVAAPFSPDITVLLLVRLLEGIALGAVPAIALAYLSEEVDVRHAAAAAGSYIAGTTVGGLSGRIVAGPIGDVVDWRTGVWATAALCAVAAVLFVWLVPRARGFAPGRSRKPGERALGGTQSRGPASEPPGVAAAGAPGILVRLWSAFRAPGQLALYAQGFLLMGAFVAVYNYLGFQLSAPPFSLSHTVVTLLFLAYLAGTVSSPWAGALATRHGRLPVLLAGIGVMAAGTALMLVPWAPAVLVGLVIMTAGFFAAHAIASGWAPARADPITRAQTSSLYYLGYYGGSSLFGWCLGLVFAALGWAGLVVGVLIMCAVAASSALLSLRAGGTTDAAR